MRTSSSRLRSTPNGGMPMNTLNGTKSSESSKARRSPKVTMNAFDTSLSPLTTKSRHIPSDAGLLLSRNTTRRKWHQSQPPPRILNIHDHRVITADNPEFSSEEEEKATRREKIWNVSDQRELDYEDYQKIKLPLEKFTVNQDTHHVNYGNLYAILTTDLLKLIIYEHEDTSKEIEDRVLYTLRLQKDVKSIYYSEAVVHAELLTPSYSPTFNTTVKSVRLNASARNLPKWASAFNNLRKIRGGTCELESFKDIKQNVKRLRLGGKDLSSLNRKSSIIRKPAQAITSTPTSTKTFYTPTVGNITYSGGTTAKRQTRSSSKEVSSPEQIIIDDAPVRRSTRKVPREVFKPALRYVFQDKTVFTIRDSDFKCLYGSEWINDSLIDFFMKYYCEKAVREGLIQPSEYHVFSTFFFAKLKSTDNHYANIQRWVSKLDFANTKFIILPINESLHWYCSIIYGIDTLIQKPEGEGKVNIYVFDSLGQKHQDIKEPISNFIIGYIRDNFQKKVGIEQIELIAGGVPRQPNFNDCGVHVIYNVSKFLSDKEQCLEIWNKKSYQWKQGNSFFVKSERQRMRNDLRDILKILQKEQIDRGDVVPDETPVDEDDDDIVYIDAKEFHCLKKTEEEEYKGSFDGEQGEQVARGSESAAENKEGEAPMTAQDMGAAIYEAIGTRSEDVPESQVNNDDGSLVDAKHDILMMKQRVKSDIDRFFSSDDENQGNDEKMTDIDTQVDFEANPEIGIEVAQSQQEVSSGIEQQNEKEYSIEMDNGLPLHHSGELIKPHELEIPVANKNGDVESLEFRPLDTPTPSPPLLDTPTPMMTPSHLLSHRQDSPDVELMDVEVDETSNVITLESPGNSKLDKVHSLDDSSSDEIEEVDMQKAAIDKEDDEADNEDYQPVSISSSQSTPHSETNIKSVESHRKRKDRKNKRKKQW